MRHRRVTQGRVGRTTIGFAVAVAVAIAGCGGSVEPGAADEPSHDVVPDGAGDGEADQEAPNGSAADEPAVPGRPPVVPPLHPAIDGLPEAVVVLASGDTQVEVDVKIAADDTSRRRGLMEVEDLPDGAGMLFVFEEERRGGFWMWNTLVPLDIAFAGADGLVHTVATMVPCEEDEPADCPITTPDAPYVAALEVPAGWFDRVGVGLGTTLTWSDPVPGPN